MGQLIVWLICFASFSLNHNTLMADSAGDADVLSKPTKLVEIYGWQSSCSSRQTTTQRTSRLLQQCASDCANAVNCQFVNFDTTTKVCTFVNKDAECSYLPISTSVLAVNTAKRLTTKQSTDFYTGRQITWLPVDDAETCKKLCLIVRKCNAAVYRKDGVCSLKVIPKSAEFKLDKTSTAFVDMSAVYGSA